MKIKDEEDIELESLEDWQKDLVKKGEYSAWDFDEEERSDDDNYYHDDD